MSVIITNTSTATTDLTTGVSSFSATSSSGEGFVIGFAWMVEWESQPTISSVVWDDSGDNQSFTLVDDVSFSTSEKRLAVYYLAAPTTAKTSTIKINWSKSCASSGIAAIIRRVSGHDAASMVRGSLTTTGLLGSGSPISNSITSSATDLVIDFLGVRNTNAYITPMSGQTSGYKLDFYGSSLSLSGSIETGASSVTTGYESVDATAYGAALIQLSVKEAAAGGVSPGAGSVIYAGYAPTIYQAGAVTVAPGAGAYVYAGYAPTITSYATIVTAPLKNNTGTVLASETGITAYVYSVSTGALVATKTGQTTSASGVMSISDVAFSSATQYRVVVVMGSGAEGMAKYTTS